MSQQLNTPTKLFIAGEALAAFRRVRLDTASENTVVYADAGEPCIGVTQESTASGYRVNVKLANAPGTFKIAAAAATSINAKLYGAADGKVSEAVSGVAEWYGVEAASADGGRIECHPIPASEIAAPGAADFQDSVPTRLATPAGGEAVGYRTLVKATASGAFTGKVDNIATLEQDATWTFDAPTEGMALRVEDEDVIYLYNGSAWVTNAHIADPAACAAMTATLSGVDTGTDMTAAQAATIVADLAALKTAIDANNAAIDSINAAQAALGITAAS